MRKLTLCACACAMALALAGCSQAAPSSAAGGSQAAPSAAGASGAGPSTAAQTAEPHIESATAESTNEKVIGMWDDYINEVDSCTTLDGGTVKTSMYNDVVAQSGDEFFVGSSTSDVLAGFTELSKSY